MADELQPLKERFDAFENHIVTTLIASLELRVKELENETGGR